MIRKYRRAYNCRMPKSPEVTRYIENAAPFARPILEKIRNAFHKGCPDVEETMKWGAPFFDHKGVLGNMAAFKQHVGWGFWKAKLMEDPEGILTVGEGGSAMGGVKVTDVSQLPPDKVLVAYVREAVRLNEEGIRQEPRTKRAPAEIEVPDDLQRALKKEPRAAATFKAFSPSNKREYIEWIADAKQDATRQKRLAQAVEWMAEGKTRNWKYQKK
jgi:uncharacterized protein YdeI (YjbR/CyaY-like superfamily)